MELCLRGDLQSAWDRLEAQFSKADNDITDDVLETGQSAAAIRIAREMEDLRQQIAKETATFVLRAVSRKEWLAMSKANLADEATGQLDEEEFVTDMITVCCVDPPMSRDEAVRLRDEALTDGQWQALATAAWDLNKNTMAVPFSLAASTRLAIAETDT